MPVSLQEARVIIDAGIARARELDQRVAVAVVDEAGNPISMDKMEGAPLLRDRFAIGKALGAVLLRRPTVETVKLREERPELYNGALNMFPGQIYLVPGGVPLMDDGRIIGAVGVAGGAAGVDDKVAEAGIAAWDKVRGAARKA
jgi:glc operon protein GlcG